VTEHYDRSRVGLVLAEVALAALTATVVAGVVMFTGLWRSRRSRRLPRLVWLHAAAVLLPFAGWAAYTASDARPGWLAVGALAVLLAVGMPSGDLLMLRAWRGRATREGRPVPGGWRAYVGAAADVLRFRRPVAAVHALAGAAGFFSVLLVTLGLGR
jgi:hypothetical protein